MTFPVSTTPPAYFSSVTPGVYAGLFYSTETPNFTLNHFMASTTYTVVNYYGATVATGTVTSSTLTLVGALPLGWYRLYLTYPSGSNATFGTSAGSAAFSVSRANILLPPRATLGTASTVDNAIRDDPIQGWSVLGPVRYYITDSANPTTGTGGEGSGGGNVPSEQAGYVNAQNWYLNGSHLDIARPRPSFCQFPNNASPITGPQVVGISSSVASLYATGITYFEGPRNEPALNGTALVTDMQTFYNAVKAGNASAKVLGPNPVSIGAQYLAAWEAFLAAGGANYVDELSFHCYNMINGDLSLGRATLSAVTAALNGAGVNKPLWMTECGITAPMNGVFEPRKQAEWFMRQTMLLEQFGIPKERSQWFYGVSHGFWGFAGFYRAGDSVTALPALARVFSEEVYGKTFTSPVSFGSPGDDMYLGSLYTNGSTGATVLVVATGGMPSANLAFALMGATTATMVDPWGNTSILTARHGLLTVPVSELPSYLRLPSGATASLAQVPLGIDYVPLGSLSTANGSVANINHMIDGNQHVDPIYSGGLNGTPWIDTTGTFPSQPTIAFPSPTRVDSVVVWAGAFWQAAGTLLDFDVQTFDGITWSTHGTVTREIPTMSTQVTSGNDWGCTRESFFDGQWIFPIPFPSVVAALAVRLNIRTATFGGEYDAASITAGGQGYPAQQVCIRAFKAFCSDCVIPHYLPI